uniref:Uncharacterized protein n=1 Tax=Rhipicephalus zambeziensis TaxID=60191 RepID=A0A224YGG5_9ACAR
MHIEHVTESYVLSYSSISMSSGSHFLCSRYFLISILFHHQHPFSLKPHQPSTQPRRHSSSSFLIVVSQPAFVSASILVSEAAETWPSPARKKKWDLTHICVTLTISTYHGFIKLS